MQDKKTLELRLSELKKKEEAARTALEARKTFLKPTVEQKMKENNDQYADNRKKYKELEKERKKVSLRNFWAVFNKDQKTKNQETLKDLDEKLNEIHDEFMDLISEGNNLTLSNNPLQDAELEHLYNIWIPLNEEVLELEKQVKELERKEIFGSNNLFVFADTKNARTYGTRGRVSVSMKIDGNNRGFVTDPVSVVSLESGIHSISFTLSFSEGELYTKDIQFSLQGNNRFVVVDKIDCSTSLYTSGANINKYDTIEEFTRKTGLTENTLANFLKSL